MVAYQFLSKAYTDILGRAPDTAGWNYWESELIRDNSANQLRRISSTFFKSDEFQHRRYSTDQRLSILFRFALNREADSAGFNYWLDKLTQPRFIANPDGSVTAGVGGGYGELSFSQVVDTFFNSQEFNNNVPKFLQPKYDFNGGTPSDRFTNYLSNPVSLSNFIHIRETETIVHVGYLNLTPFSDMGSEDFSAFVTQQRNAQLEEYKKNLKEGEFIKENIFGFTVCKLLKNPEIYISKTFISGSQQNELQQIIDNAKEGTNIILQVSAVELDRPLVLKNKVSLRPYILEDNIGVCGEYPGSPNSTSDYQAMPRFYRSPSFTDGAMIALLEGSSLSNVWVDGQRNSVDNPNFKAQNINVGTVGGQGTIVSFNRLDNSLGFSTLITGGEVNGVPRAKNTVLEGNFIDATYSNHAYKWTDGISNGGEDVVIKNNTIINATDVGIVSFALNLSPDNSQNSKIIGNKIINLVNSAYGALVSDGVFKEIDLPGGGRERLPGSKPFETKANAIELTFDHNTLWNSRGTHYDIAISIGTRVWFGEGSSSINGGTFTNNKSDGGTIRAGIGIAVAGAHNVVVSGNQLNLIITTEALSSLPKGEFIASLSSGYATFKYTDVNFADQYLSGAIQAHIGSR